MKKVQKFFDWVSILALVGTMISLFGNNWKMTVILNIVFTCGAVSSTYLATTINKMDTATSDVMGSLTDMLGNTLKEVKEDEKED